MKSNSYNLEFIMPCFSAGARQDIAEVRAPSIRGQLRWWFRALGGSKQEEMDVFGGVAGTASASSLIIRVSSVTPAAQWTPPTFTPNDTSSYVWHFAKVSGKKPGSGPKESGPRWQSSGVISSKSKFRIEILQRRQIAESLQARLDLAIEAFLQLGAMGLRATRGLGSFSCSEKPFDHSILRKIQAAGFKYEFKKESLANPDAIAGKIGSLVKGTRKAMNMKHDKPSPFGSSSPRQTSAIYFRPVKNAGSSDFSLVVFEAPHDRVLSNISWKQTVLGQNPSNLKDAAPAQRR
jgi:CRISPR type III-B/RAMP module RAMP protein Cmr1